MFSLTNVLLGMVLTAMWVVAACTVRAGCTTMKVNKPGLTGAMMLTLIAFSGAIASQFAVGMLMGMSMLGLGQQAESAEQMSMMLAMPVWMLVCAMVYRFMLPTTFGKAMIMFLAQAVILGAMLVALGMLGKATGQHNLMEVRQMLPM
jgi:hypothetical protein